MVKKINVLDELKKTAREELTLDELNELSEFCIDLMVEIEEMNVRGDKE